MQTASLGLSEVMNYKKIVPMEKNQNRIILHILIRTYVEVMKFERWHLTNYSTTNFSQRKREWQLGFLTEMQIKEGIFQRTLKHP